MIIRGDEALASGMLTAYELRTDFKRILPGVYAPKRATLTDADRAIAAVLWSRRQGVLTGGAAAAMHGATWVDPAPKPRDQDKKRPLDIELSHPNNRAPKGIRTRKENLLADEVTRIRGILVTTPARTAFDLARRGLVVPAVQALDALAQVADFTVEDVAAVAAKHPGARGCRRVPEVLDLMDSGGQSPQETYWRLRLLKEGYPRPQTQIPVPGPDGRTYFLDMGWQELMIAAEYDGEQHRTDRGQYVGDVRRSEWIALTWRRVRILGGDWAIDVFSRLRALGLRASCTPPAILLAKKGVWP